MLIVGLTGGIGSGKSTFAKIVQSLGYPVYDSDVRAKYLMQNSPEIKLKLTEYFGEEVYQDNQLNRRYLASIVFDDPKKLQILNSIVHPVVANDFEEWKNEQTSKIIFKEAAILFESGAYKQCDLNVNIVTDLDERINRVTKRDSVSKEEVLSRIANQMTDEERIKLADYNLKNNDSDDLFEEVVALLEELKEKETD